jgi:hypothetical protein
MSDFYGVEKREIAAMTKEMALHAAQAVMDDDSHFGLGAKAISWTPENSGIKVVVQVSIVNTNLLFYKAEGGKE